MIAVRLDHFGSLHLQIGAHLDIKRLEETFERRVARHELKLIARIRFAPRDVIVVLDVLEIEGRSERGDAGVQRRVFA